MLITTVKPSAVAVWVPNSGVNAADSEVAVTVFEPPVYPVLVVLIVAVEIVLAATPVTVAKPALPEPVNLTVTIVDAVAVPVHRYKTSS